LIGFTGGNGLISLREMIRAFAELASMRSGDGGARWERNAIRKPNKLMISADGGGSNGYRVRLWKVELQALADQLKLTITGLQLVPRGTMQHAYVPCYKRASSSVEICKILGRFVNFGISAAYRKDRRAPKV
jgi:Rhodopirellula transposase DDE domain